MSDTPQTDEVYDNNRGAGLAKALHQHANKLERANNAMRATLMTVANGLDSGHVQSQPLFDTSDWHAESLSLVSLRDIVEKALAIDAAITK